MRAWRDSKVSRSFSGTHKYAKNNDLRIVANTSIPSPRHTRGTLFHASLDVRAVAQLNAAVQQPGVNITGERGAVLA